MRLYPFLLALRFTNSFNPLGFQWKQIPFLSSVSLPLKLTPSESPFILLYLHFHPFVCFFFFLLDVAGLTLPLPFAVCKKFYWLRMFYFKSETPCAGWLPQHNAVSLLGELLPMGCPVGADMGHPSPELSLVHS